MKNIIRSIILLISVALILSGCIAFVPESTVIDENSEFEVHFIDVGQADAALVICDGKTMLIDGGNVEDSSLIYSYLKKHSVEFIDYMIATHPHEDHIGGLSGALNYSKVENVYSPTADYQSETFKIFADQVENNGAQIYVPEVYETFTLGSADVEILGCNSSEDANNMSIVLKVIYGETSFLFTGDAEREAEQVILESGADLKSTVLKVGHHGSANSTTYPFLREIMPEYAVVSVGEGNSYGHPHDEALSRLRDADVTVYRTDKVGTVICKSDGVDVEFAFEKNNMVKESVKKEDCNYILNINTKKFHFVSCNSVQNISKKNKDYYKGTRDELILNGYSPCGSCKP